MDPLLLSRLQFVWVIAWHILLPAFTVGLACYIATLEVLWWWKKDDVYRRLSAFWIKIFAVSFGLGVVSVPLFKAGQQIVGALGLAFPSHHVGAEEELLLIHALHEAARAISQRLGCGVYPYGQAAPRASQAEAAASDA